MPKDNRLSLYQASIPMRNIHKPQPITLASIQSVVMRGQYAQL